MDLDIKKSSKKVFSNFFEIEVHQKVFMYKVEVIPSPPNLQLTLRKFMKDNIEVVREKFGNNYMLLNSRLFSKNQGMKLNLSAEYDGVKYRMDFIGEGPFTNTNVDMKEMFTARLFKILQGRMDLKLFGRNYFNPEKAKDQSGLRIWPGYKINFKRFNSKFYLNIDTVSKVLRKDTVLDIINGVRNQQTTNWESKVRDELIGESIITHYNRQIYRIDDITFEKTPGSTFSLGTKGDEKTYETYYREKYNITIKELNQPLLITRPKKGRIKEIMLIPELCLMTGLTEKQRSDRTLMNQLNDLIKPNCNTRMSNSAEFIKFMKQNEKAVSLLDEWGVKLNPVPANLSPSIIDSGNMLMGNKKKFHFLKTNNLDRVSQCQMYSHKEFKKMIIFHCQRGKREAATFLENFKNSLKDFGMSDINLNNVCRQVEIKDDKSDEEWISESKKHLKPDVELAVYIINGNKTGNKTYKTIKQFVFSTAPVPCQVINSKTLAAKKNLRSIVNKILIQINAKLGGIPWTVDNLPFSNKPTMIMGVNTLLKGKEKRSITMVASMNSNFSKYWSTCKHIGAEDEVKVFSSCIKDAISEFKASNKTYPVQIIVYREGVGGLRNNPTVKMEVSGIQKGIKNFLKLEFPDESNNKDSDALKELSKKINFCYVSVNKNSGAKFYLGNNLTQLNNPSEGTYVDDVVTDGENDFYLLSKSTTQGTAAPTHYRILFNDFVERELIKPDLFRQMLATLSYKLCFLYYNTVGSIKIPAPIHYVNKLSDAVHENAPRNEKIYPHQHYGKIKSLYFI